MMQKVRRRRGLKNMVQTPNLKRFRNHFEILQRKESFIWCIICIGTIVYVQNWSFIIVSKHNTSTECLFSFITNPPEDIHRKSTGIPPEIHRKSAGNPPEFRRKSTGNSPESFKFWTQYLSIPDTGLWNYYSKKYLIFFIYIISYRRKSIKN